LEQALEMRKSHENIENISEEEEVTSSPKITGFSQIIYLLLQKRKYTEIESFAQLLFFNSLDCKQQQQQQFSILNGNASLCLSNSQNIPTNFKTIDIQKESDVKKVSILNDDIDSSPQSVYPYQKSKKTVPIPVPSIAGVLHVFQSVRLKNRQALCSLFLMLINV
jgi:hypothetical protein